MVINREQLQKFIKEVYPFYQMDEALLSFLAEKCEVVFYKKGDLVYQEGAPARFLYVLFEGQIDILKEVKHLIVRMNHMRMGDVFGEDVLELNCTRRTTARAEKDCLLIRIRLSSLAQIVKRSSRMQVCLQFMLRSYQIHLKNVSKTANQAESLRFICHPHEFSWILKPMVGFLVLMLACAALVGLVGAHWLPTWQVGWGCGLLAAIFIFWLLWNYIKWRNNFIIFTNQRAIHHATNILFQEIREDTPLNAIVSLAGQTNWLGRKFAFGNLSIKTLTGLLQLKYVPYLDEAHKLLEFLIDKQKREYQAQEKKEFETLLRERLAASRAISAEPEWPSKQTAPHAEEDTREQDFFSRLFGLQRQIGPSMIYRTHWIFMMKKTLFAFLVLLSLLLLEIYLYSNQLVSSHNTNVVWFFRISEILALLTWLYQFMDWRNDQYIITPEQIIDVYQKPFGLTDRRAAPLENIQSIRIERQGIAGMLFDFGSVFVKVGNEDFSFENVNHPMEIQQTLFGLLEQTRRMEKEEERTGQQHRLLDWLETFQRYTGESSKENQTEEKLDKLE